MIHFRPLSHFIHFLQYSQLPPTWVNTVLLVSIIKEIQIFLQHQASILIFGITNGINYFPTNSPSFLLRFPSSAEPVQSFSYGVDTLMSVRFNQVCVFYFCCPFLFPNTLLLI